MSERILQGDVFEHLPGIEPGSVDCVVTSPPYWMLRSYLPKGHPLKMLEIGQEKTPAEFVEKLVRVFRLVRDALADHGTCFVNVGDTYTHSRGKRKPGDKHGPKQCTNEGSVSMPSATIDGVEEGNLALIPQRLAIALQADGWIVRSIVCWQKPSPMPASLAGWRWSRCLVKIANGDRMEGEKKARSSNGKPHGTRAANGKDYASTALWEDCPGCKMCQPNNGYVLRIGSWRPTRSYEPILMLAKTADYFADGEPVKTRGISSGGNGFGRVLDEEGTTEAGGSTSTTESRERYDSGANLRDVWKTPLAEMSKEDLIGFIQGLERRSSARSMADLQRASWREPLRRLPDRACAQVLARGNLGERVLFRKIQETESKGQPYTGTGSRGRMRQAVDARHRHKGGPSSFSAWREQAP